MDQGNRRLVNLIMTRLAKGAETSISMTFLRMYAEKIRRHLRLCLSLSFLVLRLAKARLPLDGAQESLPA